MDGQPNNITADGLELVSLLVEGGLDPAYLNFYVAALYNSDVAIEFLEAAGSGTSFSVKIPRQRLERKRMLTLSTTGRTIRDLIWLKNLAEGEEQLGAEGLEQLISVDLIESTGLRKEQVASRRFRGRSVYRIPDELSSRIEETTESLQTEIDKMVADLYT